MNVTPRTAKRNESTGIQILVRDIIKAGSHSQANLL